MTIAAINMVANIPAGSTYQAPGGSECGDRAGHSQALELFAVDEEVAALEGALATASDAQRLEVLLALSWHQRQRDTVQSLTLADEASALLGAFELPDADVERISARLHLIRAEANWLIGDLDGAQDLVDEAQALFSQHSDAVGVGDACWLAASIARVRGDASSADQWMVEAEASYANADDRDRRLAIRLRRIREMALSDVVLAKRLLDAEALEANEVLHAAVATWFEDAHAIVLTDDGDAAAGFSHFVRSFQAALASGQLRHAILTATNVAMNFQSLNDLDSALEWHERALGLARKAGWKSVWGTTQCRAASTLSALGQHEASMRMLQEGLPSLPDGSPVQASAWIVLADTLCATGDFEAATHWYANAVDRYQALGAYLDLTRALQGLASASLELGNLVLARKFCMEALTAARRHGLGVAESAVLGLAAQVCQRARSEGLLPQAEMALPLHYLQEALRIAQSIDGYNTPAKLLESLAAEYAHSGDMAQAYRLALEAGEARERAQSNEASNRAISLQVRHETERHKLEAQHHRQLGQAQAQRVDALSQANETLELLGEIGRNITASLDAGAVFAALYKHNRQLLDAFSVVVCRIDERQRKLVMDFGVEAGAAIAPFEVSLDDPNSKIAQCARERRELLIDIDARSEFTVPGTVTTRSMLFAPLVVGERLLGVMTIQSPRPHAYAERERAIFRTLCAYGAIALSNAEAQSLVVAKSQELERLATTDVLTELYNRRFLNTVLVHELALAQRYGTAFSLVILDVDHFKRVNDTYGHPAGDMVLSSIGDLLKERVRITDIPGRWGGEEFLVVCPNTNLQEASRAGQSLRMAIEQHQFGEVGRCTVSVGVATFRSGDTIMSLESRADRALYLAKQGGRNQVVVGE